MPVERLPSGSYRVRVSAGPIEGTNRYRTLRRTLPATATKADLARAELELQIEADVSSATGDTVTVSAMCSAWVAVANIADSTRYGYGRLLGKHVDGTGLGESPISRVTAGQLEVFYSGLPIGPASVRKLHGVVSKGFGRAVRLGWVASSPAAFVDLGEVCPLVKPDVRAADPVDYRGVLARCVDEEPPSAPGLATYVRVLGSTGCRRGEALALRWGSLRDGSLLFDSSVAVVPGVGVIVKGTKTGRPRSVRLGSSVLAALESHRARCAELALLRGHGLADDMFMFSVDGAGVVPWRPDTVGKWVTARGVRPNMLRHMAATQGLATGQSAETVARRLGNSARMVAEVYADYIPALDQSLADEWDRLAD